MLRLGIVDFDSSHSIEFTRRINRRGISTDQFVDGAQVVLGFPGGSPDARSRVELFAPEIVGCGVELVDDPRAMIGRIDGVLILSLAGDRHRAAAEPFLAAGVPTYVDKPVACRLEDLDALIGLARDTGTLLWSSSASRFCDDVVAGGRELERLGRMTGLQVFGPAHESSINRGLFHYGIHITETMYTLMGPGCERLTALTSPDCDLIGARWRDGRIASIRGHRRGHTGYGYTGFTEAGVVHRNISLHTAYRNLCRQIVTAFETGVAPVSLDETREIVRFLEAAEVSRQRDALAMSLN